jgi:tetratricopeptide (TPR) repeat protein
MMDARQLFKAYRFDESVSAYKNQLQRGVGSREANVDGLGKALMAAGAYAEALPYLEEADESELRAIPAALGRKIQIGVCQWIAGDRRRGIETIRRLILAVQSGTVTFGDLAGGVSQGLILHYMAVTLKSDEDLELALSYLKNRASHSRIKYWPGPAALFLMGKLDLNSVLNDGVGSTDLASAKKIAATDLLKRRHLTNILFSAAAKCRAADDEQTCMAYLTECAGLANPLIEYEWHLAKSELSENRMSSDFAVTYPGGV